MGCSVWYILSKEDKNQHYLLLPESPKAMIGQTGMLFILI